MTDCLEDKGTADLRIFKKIIPQIHSQHLFFLPSSATTYLPHSTRMKPSFPSPPPHPPIVSSLRLMSADDATHRSAQWAFSPLTFAGALIKMQ